MKEPSTPPGMSESPAPADLTGKTLGDFVVLRRLGQGGMGQVYLAEQISLKRKVALKVLKPELASNETSLKRFQLEAEAVARVTHANIVQVYAIGMGEGLHYMALEYVDGFTLADYLQKKGTPELTLALAIMKQVASALARACELGIIHRDIKPENILLTRKGEVKVTDFGLSRCFGDKEQPTNLTSSGVAMGTPLYMSPEQVQGQPIDPRTDVYSFGVTCYHMLSGQPPFRGQSAFDVAVQHVQKVAEPLAAIRPDLPPALCAIVEKMMAKNPSDRYQTGREIIHDVNRVRAALSQTAVTGNISVPVATVAPTPADSSRATRVVATPARPVRRFPIWQIGLFVASIVVAAVAGSALAWKLQRPGTTAEPFVSTEEQLLRQQAARPRSAKQGEAEHAQKQLNLALFYLDRGRVDDAEAAFRRVTDAKDIAQLGKALVLAFQDKPHESYEAFLEFKKALDEQPERAQQLLSRPHLRQTIARALERNRINGEAVKEPFPPELEKLRRPGPAR
jgi:serine/threonine-protein kinase